MVTFIKPTTNHISLWCLLAVEFWLLLKQSSSKKWKCCHCLLFLSCFSFCGKPKEKTTENSGLGTRDRQAKKDVDEFVSSSEQIWINSVAWLGHQWILCSEWVPSEWKCKQLIKTSQWSTSNLHNSYTSPSTCEALVSWSCVFVIKSPVFLTLNLLLLAKIQCYLSIILLSLV